MIIVVLIFLKFKRISVNCEYKKKNITTIQLIRDNKNIKDQIKIITLNLIYKQSLYLTKRA